jgi:hypothetical protein
MNGNIGSVSFNFSENYTLTPLLIQVILRLILDLLFFVLNFVLDFGHEKSIQDSEINDPKDDAFRISLVNIIICLLFDYIFRYALY